MRRLDGTSAFLIYAESPQNYQHTLKITILDLPDDGSFDHEGYMQGLEVRLDSAPYLRWKVAKAPLGIHHPYWIQDLDFDLSHHVTRIACPSPGDKNAFCKLVSDLYSQPLDKSLPLWKTWVIEGLQENRVAIVTMLHHAYTDGVGFSHVLNTLMSTSSPAKISSEELGVDSSKNPSRAWLFIDSLVKLPFFLLVSLPGIVNGTIAARRFKKGYLQQGKSLPPEPSSAPASPLNVALSPGRTFYYGSFPLAEFKAASKLNQVTMNELLLAVVTGAVRSYYAQRDEPMSEPLIAAIPVNARTAEQQREILGNFVYSASVSLPIHIEDPAERLSFIKHSSKTMKEYVKASSGNSVLEGISLLPPAAISMMQWLVKKSEGRIGYAGNLTVSNVPGPTEYLKLGKIDGKVSDWLSIGQVTFNMGLNITAWRYVNKFSICVMADKKVIPNGEQFMSYMTRAFEDYVHRPIVENDTAQSFDATEEPLCN